MIAILVLIISSFLYSTNIDYLENSESNMIVRQSIIAHKIQTEIHSYTFDNFYQVDQVKFEKSGLPTIEYPKGKVYLKGNDVPIIGKTVRVYSDRIELEFDRKTVKSYPLKDVNMVEGKGRKPRKMAAVCGFGCIGTLTGIYILSRGEGENYSGGTSKIDPGPYFSSSVMWGVLSAGVGALIGSIVDDWTVIYKAELMS